MGFCTLIWGGGRVVKSATKLALKTSIPASLIGMTIIAFGTSLPELIASIFANIKNAPDIVVGNVVGSNIFNILLVVGISSLLSPLRFSEKKDLEKDLRLLIIASLTLFLFIFNLSFSVFEALSCLVVAGIIFYISFKTKKDPIVEDIEEAKNIYLEWFFLVLGLVGLLLGAHFMLESALILGRSLGISERILGIFLVSVGTGIPELTVSVFAAFKRQADLAIANIVGSNLINTLGITGFAGLFGTLTIDKDLVFFDSLFMIFITLIFFGLIYVRKANFIPRWLGGLFILLYLGYIALALVFI